MPPEFVNDQLLSFKKTGSDTKFIVRQFLADRPPVIGREVNRSCRSDGEFLGGWNDDCDVASIWDRSRFCRGI